MSETNWTPGPWEVDQYGDVIANGEDVAHVVSTIGDYIATSRLVAAAPELYQALEKACKETEHFQFETWLVTECPSGDCEEVQRKWLESSDYKDFIDEWRDQLDALAKARGEQ